MDDNLKILQYTSLGTVKNFNFFATDLRFMTAFELISTQLIIFNVNILKFRSHFNGWVIG
jgi:hypothetical protein